MRAGRTGWSRVLLLGAVTLCVSACSVVFDAGVGGTVVDRARYEENPDTAGVDAVDVFLYLNDRGRQRDRERHDADGLLPDEAGADGTTPDRYYLKSVTGTAAGGQAGAFSFSNILWHDLLPRFGRSGDRREIFFLFYHPEYGLQPRSAFIVSETTNRLAPLKIDTLLTSAQITGTLVDAGSDAAVAGADVHVYVPETYADGSFTYTTAAQHQLTTGAAGGYSGRIEFSRGLAADPGNVELLLTFSHDDYQATTAADAQLRNDRDLDGDGSNDTYFPTPPIAEGEEAELPTIGLRRISFTETLHVQVGADADADGVVDASEGTNGLVVRLYFNRSAAPTPGDQSDYQSTTTIRLVGSEVQPGWATFSGLRWTDTSYTGAQSSVVCYVDIDVDGDGSIGGSPDADNITTIVVSDADNTVSYAY